MNEPTQLLADHLDRLLVAGLLSLAVGLTLMAVKRWRAFGLMTAAWGAVDAAIALIGSNPSPVYVASLTPTVAFNEGLNVAYVAVGVTMALLAGTRPNVRAFGLAIVVQGAVLLLLDGKLWLDLTHVRVVRN